jgi:glutamyl-tRNA synthetase
MSEVRVRIAPSPTGSPHVGTAYMGLFNYAFAKSHGGKFVLRIEDTDQTRSRKEYETGIFNALRWLGLSWDEGPDTGGPCVPYRQSERTEIYREHAQKLLDSGAAYRCFCSESRLAELRARQREEKGQFGYDGFCRNLPAEEIEQKLRDELPHVVRLKIPHDTTCVFKDRLHGEVSYDNSGIDDQILLKSDRFPTYHLANVVDDHLMGITHIIRGEEWLPSTPKHVLLYQAFGWAMPEFIHMPLLLNPDGSKLSKRKNPTSVNYYRDAGFLPQTLLNYLGLMSYSRPNQEEKFTLEEFVSDFNIDRISLGGSIFDLKKLTWLNGRYIRENYDPQSLLREMRSWRMNDEYFTALVAMMQNRMETLGDIFPKCSFAFLRDVEFEAETLVPKDRTIQEIPGVLQTALYMIDGITDWNAAGIEAAIHEVVEFWQWPIRDVTGVLFVALTGSKVAPPLYDSMALLGSDLVRRRLLEALEKAGGIGKKKEAELEKRWKTRKGI